MAVETDLEPVPGGWLRRVGPAGAWTDGSQDREPQSGRLRRQGPSRIVLVGGVRCKVNSGLEEGKRLHGRQQELHGLCYGGCLSLPGARPLSSPPEGARCSVRGGEDADRSCLRAWQRGR
jgi:hypothetical protein